MSVEDRQIAWKQVEESFYSEVRLDIGKELQQFWEQSHGRVQSALSEIPGLEKSPSELMADAKYQAIADNSASPLAIDRVSQDGPRDFSGEIQEVLESGPLYDMTRMPRLVRATRLEDSVAQGEVFGAD